MPRRDVGLPRTSSTGQTAASVVVWAVLMSSNQGRDASVSTNPGHSAATRGAVAEVALPPVPGVGADGGHLAHLRRDVEPRPEALPLCAAGLDGGPPLLDQPVHGAEVGLGRRSETRADRGSSLSSVPRRSRQRSAGRRLEAADRTPGAPRRRDVAGVGDGVDLGGGVDVRGSSVRTHWRRRCRPSRARRPGVDRGRSRTSRTRPSTAALPAGSRPRPRPRRRRPSGVPTGQQDRSSGPSLVASPATRARPSPGWPR